MRTHGAQSFSASDGTAGNDQIDFRDQTFQVTSRIAGGAGTDTLLLREGADDLVFAPTTISGIEALSLAGGHRYRLVLADDNVAAGQTLSIAGSGLRVTDSIAFDGSAETNGRFELYGGPAAGVFTGGNGGDLVSLGGGRDTLRYTAASQSTASGFDTVVNLDAAVDRLQTWNRVTAVDAPMVGGKLARSTFDTDMTANAANLLAHHAALFKATSGNLSGVQFLLVDTNGIAGYQAGGDLVLRLDGALNLDRLGKGNFV